MPLPRYGYCCRPKIKGYIEGQCFGTVRLWFSLDLDAASNVDSSNPQKLYDHWRRIAAQDDHGERYVKGLRDELDEVVRRSSLPPGVRQKLRQQIKEASMDNFQPERLRLDLSWIARRRGCSVAALLDECRRAAAAEIQPPQRLQDNEYLIDGLPLDAFAAWCRLL